jgi:hypothetical protein
LSPDDNTLSIRPWPSAAIERSSCQLCFRTSARTATNSSDGLLLLLRAARSLTTPGGLSSQFLLRLSHPTSVPDTALCIVAKERMRGREHHLLNTAHAVLGSPKGLGVSQYDVSYPPLFPSFDLPFLMHHFCCIVSADAALAASLSGGSPAHVVQPGMFLKQATPMSAKA